MKNEKKYNTNTLVSQKEMHKKEMFYFTNCTIKKDNYFTQIEKSYDLYINSTS